MDALIEELNREHLKKDLPIFGIGDTIRVSTKIVEGDKERIQTFQGTVIARKGKNLTETFTLHRVSYGEGMERVFNLHSPRIVNIEVIKRGRVRRAKLYYLRGTSGKKAKVVEKIGDSKEQKEEQRKGKKNARQSNPEPTNLLDDTPAEIEEALTETVEANHD